MTLQNAFEGLATEAKQDDVVTSLGEVAAGFAGLATEAKQNDEITSIEQIVARLPAVLGTAGGLKVAIVGGASTGGATETTLVEIKDLIDALATATEVQPVSGPLTDAQLRAAAVPVSGPLTDAQIRASALPVSGPLTDGQLRASPLALPTGAASEATLSSLSGKVGVPSADDLLSLLRDIKTNTGQEVTAVQNLKLTADQVNLNTDTLESLLGTTNSRLGTTGVAGSVAALLDAIRINQANQAVNATLVSAADISDRAGRLLGHITVDNASLAVTGPLTDAQLRAAVVAVSGPLTDAQLRAAAVPVSGPLTDAQLRASALPVSLDLSALSTAANQVAQTALLTAIRDYVDGVETLLGGVSTEATLAAMSAKYPAVAALADAVANPSLTKIGSFLHGYNGVTWDRLRSDTANGLDVDATRLPPDVTTTGSLSATGSVTLALSGQGARSLYSVAATGVYTGVTFTNEVSFDNGASYLSLPVIRSDSIGANPASASSTIAGTNMWFLAPLPAGATHVRARVTAIASGTVTFVLGASISSAMPWSSIAGSTATITSTLASGNNNVGFIRNGGMWVDETSTPLAGAGTFTGSSIDLIATASGSNFTGATSAFAKELRALATSDVAGTLSLEVSRDNTTWRRVYSVAMSNTNTDVVGAGGAIYKAEIQHLPATRYARFVFINGAGAQSHFMLESMRLGA